MKKLALAIFLFSFTVMASSPEDASDFSFVAHEEICESEKAIQLMGEKGSCKLLVIPQEKRNIGGTCYGQLRTIQCKVTFAQIEVGAAALNMNCGGTEQEMDAEGVSYKVAALIRTEAGKKKVLNDARRFTYLSSKMLNVKLVQESDSLSEAEVSLDLGLGKVELTNVMCFLK